MQSHYIYHVLLPSIPYPCVPFLEMLFLAVHLHTHPSMTRTILTSPPSRAPHPLPWRPPCPCARSITGTVWLVRDPPGWGSWSTTLTILRLLGVWVGGTLSVLTSVAGMSIPDYLGVLGRGWIMSNEQGYFIKGNFELPTRLISFKVKICSLKKCG